MFETDVAYSGRHITRFFDSYDDDSDFITLDCHDPGGWMHGSASTPEFQKLRGTGTGLANIRAALEARQQRCDQHKETADCNKPITDKSLYVSVEAVQRFSSKMMAEMVRLNNKGVHSWSEQSGCTYAAAAGLKISKLNPKHVSGRMLLLVTFWDEQSPNMIIISLAYAQYEKVARPFFVSPLTSRYWFLDRPTIYIF